jgi:hypothetical protein
LGRTHWSHQYNIPVPARRKAFFLRPLHGLGKGWRLASPRLPPLPGGSAGPLLEFPDAKRVKSGASKSVNRGNLLGPQVWGSQKWSIGLYRGTGAGVKVGLMKGSFSSATGSCWDNTPKWVDIQTRIILLAFAFEGVSSP